MKRSLAIVPIVEGHAEEAAVPILLRRIGIELFDNTFIMVGRPIRIPRGQLVKYSTGKLASALNLAQLKLTQMSGDYHKRAAVVLIDADDDLACQLGPGMLAEARQVRGDLESRVILPTPEFETWFVASADDPRMSVHLNVDPSEVAFKDAEANRLRKKWIEQRFVGKYSETVDQPKLTSVLNLPLLRQRAPSFDKLCRDIESLLQ